MKKITIMCGLPGSGKTTFAKKLENEGYNYHDFDSFTLQNKVDTFSDYFIEEINKYENHVIDGLFLTNNDYKKILKLIFENREYIFQRSIYEVEFRYFIPNREQSLKNDKLRNRDKLATVTIMNAKVEEPDIQMLESHLGDLWSRSKVKLIKHKTYPEQSFEVEADKFIRKKGLRKILHGKAWNVSGNVCDYTGDCYEIEPDDEPEKSWDNFINLKELFEDIFPEVPDKIKSDILDMVYIDYGRGDGDYYGGYVNASSFAINVEQMYKYLYDNELITMAKLLGGNI